jgi:hypothetical protein
MKARGSLSRPTRPARDAIPGRTARSIYRAANPNPAGGPPKPSADLIAISCAASAYEGAYVMCPVATRRRQG